MIFAPFPQVVRITWIVSGARELRKPLCCVSSLLIQSLFAMLDGWSLAELKRVNPSVEVDSHSEPEPDAPLQHQKIEARVILELAGVQIDGAAK